jgi:hypothetical protein
MHILRLIFLFFASGKTSVRSMGLLFAAASLLCGRLKINFNSASFDLMD